MRFGALMLLISCVLVHFVEFVLLLCYEMGKFLDLREVHYVVNGRYYIVELNDC